MHSRNEQSLGSPSCTRLGGSAGVPSATRRSKGWYSRGYLPHLDVSGLIQHITFHLADSLPGDALEQMERQLLEFPEDKKSVERRKRFQELLDSGIGSCVLGRDDCANIVEESLLFGDGSRYQLLAWVIMPNHVHVLIEQISDCPLAKVVQSWKRHTSRQIHLLGSSSGIRHLSAGARPIPPPNPLWQRDYWDRFVRNERHFQTVKHYIENNPVAAGLVDSAELWPWGSARFAKDAECNSAIPG